MCIYGTGLEQRLPLGLGLSMQTYSMSMSMSYVYAYSSTVGSCCMSTQGPRALATPAGFLVHVCWVRPTSIIGGIFAVESDTN